MSVVHAYRTVRELGGLIRFSHTIFALPFAILGGVLASHTTTGWTFRGLDWLGILASMVTARSAAMAFNRLADRKIDALNPRTAGRHLPSGRLSVGLVLAFTLACGLLFLASTALFLPRNPWPIALSVPVLLWLMAYSLTKRMTSLAHFWLGISLGMAPVAAWIAIRAGLAWPPIWLGLAVLFWVAGFDLIYACQDADFDRSAGLHSIPARLGIRGALRLAAACHLMTLVAFAGLGMAYPMGWIYWVGLACVAGLLVYEHALVKPDDLSRVNEAFFQVNAVISLGLLIASVADLML
ncbi:MAG: UbiA-like polyprenyltransferase [Isosphaeraceae bacterium]